MLPAVGRELEDPAGVRMLRDEEITVSTIRGKIRHDDSGHEDIPTGLQSYPPRPKGGPRDLVTVTTTEVGN